MNHGEDDDDNHDDMDEDYDGEGNDDDNNNDDDDEFTGYDDGDDMCYILSKDIRRSQTNTCNDEIECSVGHHGFIDIGTYTSYIPNPNPF